MSKNDEMYFDSKGNRIKLDTRHLEWCNTHKPRRTAGDGKVERKATVIGVAMRVVAFAFCLWFSVKHIDVYSTSLRQIVEGILVVVCLVYMSSRVDNLIFRKKR